ncbi:FeoA family protein [Simplicispira psychrophila]|uniref:FeoA family protein n=1 Tax=Simplicispira psychrophila TaxID=80882 RepID=UPI000A042C6E|nr:FeoA family protein [Simplicispira psychrophila]
MKNAPAAVAADCGLADVPLHTDVWVCALQLDGAPQDHDVLLRLLEIGFLPGERLRVVARSFPGGDPLAVRVGRTTFALRRREAGLVRVSTTPPVLVRAQEQGQGQAEQPQPSAQLLLPPQELAA